MTIGSRRVEGGGEQYAIPGVPAEIEAMPWAGSGTGVLVRWAWAGALLGTT